MELFAARLKWCRERKNLTQKQVAEMIEMTQSSYSKYEYNLRQPKLEILSKLPKILEESSDFLIGATDYTRNCEVLKNHFDDSTHYVAAIINDLEEIRINPQSKLLLTPKDFDPDDQDSILDKLERLEKQLPLWKDRMEIARQKVLSMLDEIPLVSISTYNEIQNESGWVTVLQRKQEDPL